MSFRMLAVLVPLIQCSAVMAAVTIEDGLKLPGFQTFPTPRTFDGPGTVFRITDGKKFTVTELKVRLHPAGTEEFADYKRNVDWSFELLGRFLGLAKAAVGAGGSLGVERDQQFTLRHRTGHPTRTYDAEIRDSLRRANIEFAKGSRYYVIREVISIKNLYVDAGPTWRADVKANVAWKKLVNGRGEAKWADASQTTLIRSFKPAHHVFYVAEQVLPPGVGITEPGSPRLAALDPDEVIHWQEESTEPVGR